MLTLTRAQAESLASLRHATPQAKADRDMTPVLSGVHIVVAAGVLTATATDRYMVGEVAFPAAEGEDADVVVDFADLVRVAASMKSRKAASVAVDFAEAAVAYPDGSTDRLTYIGGNFPAVGRLFPDVDYELPAEAGFNLDLFARANKIFGPGNSGPWRLTGGRKDDGRPGPWLMTRPGARVVAQSCKPGT
jgi:DNA polymerase III sliding clamp (beta) subunit (PCNA family)